MNFNFDELDFMTSDYEEGEVVGNDDDFETAEDLDMIRIGENTNSNDDPDNIFNYADISEIPENEEDLILSSNDQVISEMQIDDEQINDKIDEFNKKRNLELNKEQRDAVMNAMHNQNSILTGGPGRGKSLTIAAIAHVWSKLTSDPVMLLAPTGKAVARLKQIDQQYIAKTIDSFNETSHEKIADMIAGKTRKKGMLDRVLFIIDETSMLGIIKASKFLANAAMIACEPHFVFVGDRDQLSPIATGNFFKDIIASGSIPMTVLVTPMRNGGNILANLTKINDGNTDLVFGDDFKFIANSDTKSAQKAIVDLYINKIKETKKFSSVAVISPIKKSLVGVFELNKTIQNIINPFRGRIANEKQRSMRGFATGIAYDKTQIRIGDYVTITENGTATVVVQTNDGLYVEREQIDIANGDTGTVKEYRPSQNVNTGYGTRHIDEYVIVKLSSGDIIKLTGNSAKKLELAYCLTAHKSQGSEYNTVIYSCPADMTKFNQEFSTRNIVYTALSRAQKEVITIGDRKALDFCIENKLRTGASDIPDMLSA